MAAVGGVNNEPYFGNCESVTDHGLDRGPRYADRALLGRSGPVQNRSGLAGPRFLDRTVATLRKSAQNSQKRDFSQQASIGQRRTLQDLQEEHT